MKHFLTISLCFFALSLSAQLTSISVETYLVHDGVAISELAGYTTYHVYANTQNSEDFVSAVFGDSENALDFSSTGTVFQSTPSFNYGNEPNPDLFQFLPPLEYDSWFTIGMMLSSDGGAISNVGMDAAMADFASTGDFYIDDPIGGSWFYPGFPCGGTPIVDCANQYVAFGGADNKVLLAQITTDGYFTGVFNVQIFVEGIQSNTVNYNGFAFSSPYIDILGCMDQAACNFYSSATVDDGSCEYLSCAGCLDQTACNFYSSATVDDGSCEYLSCAGCLDQTACNFDSSATVDDGSCEYLSCVGCTDVAACNYDSSSIIEDGSCMYPEQYYDCFGNCLNDIDGDGICDTIPGCTDSTALNYNPSVSVDDGSCCYPSFSELFPEGLIIPDDQSQCFSSQLTYSNFNAGAVVNNANVDIENIFMNFEHSYMGDLIITFTCPNGYSLVVHEQGGGGTDLGVPVYNLPDNPGIGWDYWWEPGATNGTWSENAQATLPSGSYESVQPFAYLNGCSLNGTWQVEVCDVWGQDNGFIFDWGINDGMTEGDCNFYGLGCTDSFACNYIASAIEDDGSCDYSCCPGPGCCSTGMYWDWELGICEMSIPTDSNLDGCTDLNDLIDLLANYGDCSAFTCGDDIEHEGYSYSTVQIGDQCWFSENCRYLPVVSPSSAGSNISPYYYVYDYQGSTVEEAIATYNYESYGVLYNWPAVMNEGICPSAWHVPSDGEFIQLTDFLGGWGVAGDAMKSTSGWNNGGNGSNSSGFTGLPGGSRSNDGYFASMNDYGYFWSSSAQNGPNAWGRVLSNSHSYVGRYGHASHYGKSARCIKD